MPPFFIFVSGRVPDRRTPRALLHSRRNCLRRDDIQLLRLNCRPSWRRDLQRPGIVEGVHTRIEIRIGPHALQLHVANGIGVRRIGDVHRGANRRHLAGNEIRFAVTGPGNVIYFLEALPVRRPAFDDLNTIEVAGGGVFHDPH